MRLRRRCSGRWSLLIAILEQVRKVGPYAVPEFYRFARVPMRRAATSGVAGTGHAAGGRQYRTQWKTAYRLVRAWPFQPQARVYDQRLACTTSRASHLIRICTTQAEPGQH